MIDLMTAPLSMEFCYALEVDAQTDAEVIADAMAAIDRAVAVETLDPNDVVHPAIVILSRAGGCHCPNQRAARWLLVLGCIYGLARDRDPRPN